MSAERDLLYVKLSDLAEVTGGVTLGRTIPDAASVELPYLRVANVQDGYIDTSDLKTVRVLQSEVQRFTARKGDVLITEGGDFDKVGRGAVWDGRFSPCLHQNHLFRVRCHPGKLLPEYLAIYLASSEGRRYFLSIAKQTTNLASINSSQLKAMPIPRRRLEDQRRVVEVLEALGKQELAIEAAVAKLDFVEEGLLQSAFESRDREGVVSDLGAVVTGTTPPPDWDPVGLEGGIPFFTPSQVRDAEGTVSGAERSIARSRADKIRTIPAGSTVAVCIGFGAGKVALSGVECCTNQQINAVIPFQGFDHRFVYLAVRYAMRRAKSLLNLQVTPIINKTDFSQLPVPVPSETEQEQLVEKIWAVRTKKSSLIAEKVKLGNLKAGLSSDLLSVV
ncbi:restriction endonuclease subunit S [Streptomyces iakyrus]|uniref:Restriction endonuclease subunit S n=1 Tax=Streptomyces iakyrus TaxID=68219 RepID=A0ABW8FDL8_9ACTN|nr:restriction endonuclease subunit S [Streptomyces coralus]WLW52794.1 restriction endonuclease subunit S [Streptomyces coralus]